MNFHCSFGHFHIQSINWTFVPGSGSKGWCFTSSCLGCCSKSINHWSKRTCSHPSTWCNQKAWVNLQKVNERTWTSARIFSMNLNQCERSSIIFERPNVQGNYSLLMLSVENNVWPSVITPTYFIVYFYFFVASLNLQLISKISKHSWLLIQRLLIWVCDK